MTTITLRGDILAADTQLTDSNIRTLCHKIIRLHDGRVVACAGDCDEEEDFLAWLNGDLKNLPKRNKTTAIMVEENGTAWSYFGCGHKILIEHPYAAIGSGAALAMGFMSYGLDAVAAIKAVAEIEVNTNNLVDSYNVKTRKFKKAF